MNVRTVFLLRCSFHFSIPDLLTLLLIGGRRGYAMAYHVEMGSDFKPLIYQINIPRLIANNVTKITTCGTKIGWPPRIINTTIERIAAIRSTT